MRRGDRQRNPDTRRFSRREMADCWTGEGGEGEREEDEGDFY